MKYDSDNSRYGCNDCNERLTLHADGAVTCSCSALESTETHPPKAWDITSQELAAWRQREIEYQEAE